MQGLITLKWVQLFLTVPGVSTIRNQHNLSNSHFHLSDVCVFEQSWLPVGWPPWPAPASTLSPTQPYHSAHPPPEMNKMLTSVHNLLLFRYMYIWQTVLWEFGTLKRSVGSKTIIFLKLITVSFWILYSRKFGGNQIWRIGLNQQEQKYWRILIWCTAEFDLHVATPRICLRMRAWDGIVDIKGELPATRILLPSIEQAVYESILFSKYLKSNHQREIILH
jgi:hypothetical protein